jgi:hypothetical protein
MQYNYPLDTPELLVKQEWNSRKEEHVRFKYIAAVLGLEYCGYPWFPFGPIRRTLSLYFMESSLLGAEFAFARRLQQ